MVKDYPGEAQGGCSPCVFLCFPQGREDEMGRSAASAPSQSTEVRLHISFHFMFREYTIDFLIFFAWTFCFILNLSIFTVTLCNRCIHFPFISRICVV